MYAQILITQGILLACVLVGWFVGRAIHRFADNRFTEGSLQGHELGRLTDTLAFVGGAVGILLGLLLSFGVTEFDDTKSNIQAVARSSVGVFTASETLEESQRFEVRRDTVCTLRSISTSDWQAIGNGVIGGSQSTEEWLLKLNTDVSRVSLETNQQQGSYPVLLSSVSDLTNAREELVMGNTAMIPEVVWMVIFFASFIMAALLAMHLADRKWLARISAAMAWGMLAVILLALTVLDSPLAPILGTPTIEPTAITEALTTIQESFPGSALLSACPETPAN
ncbi:hypothetical protein AINA4_03460 [Aurantimicrobium sp. INA4]|uniref:bestrophin-like domain n=1 Tax=Aurantimicrobium sp. INA4 TaxID=2986279 RepID=UPI002490492E|nr:hypothetical protein [Aurantimicrobium sp. INA4]BDU10425.1 hypothetical protein AINA4_03460 [Aurantimicrobium sp. INA4]